MAVDRLAPMMLNLAEGASTWREHGITRSRVVARNGRFIEQSLPGAWNLVLAQLDAAVADGRVDPT
jgi:putative hydrolase of HD superfamily